MRNPFELDFESVNGDSEPAQEFETPNSTSISTMSNGSNENLASTSNQSNKSVCICIEETVKSFLALGYSTSNIEAIGIASQRETALVWDWETGEPLHNAITWTDTRTVNLVRELKEKPGADELVNICRLPLSTYPSSVTLRWMLDHLPDVKSAYEDGRVAFGTIDTLLIYNLNGGPRNKRLVTEVTNTSWTMFMNLEILQYDDRLLKFFDIDRNKIRLPEILPSADPKGGVRITSCLGDQASALVGHCAFTPGMAKNTYGTGCFLYNVGDKPPVYALEGSVAVGGSFVSFLMKNLGFFRDSCKVSDLASSVPDNRGCLFVTAFGGLFVPYWVDDAQGTIWGITAHTQKGHIARATMEAACFQKKAILDTMAMDSGYSLKELAVDGGMSNYKICMQTQIGIIQIPVERPSMHETTALGAAIAAGFAIDIWKDFSELEQMNRQPCLLQRINWPQSQRLHV
ncbi:hypothetical protein LT330_010689 [Penicillium expansum]|nr:hypothetical protein LT330_010689 [Penicillium expansum]